MSKNVRLILTFVSDDIIYYSRIFVDPIEFIKRSNCESIFKLIRTYRILLKSECLQMLLPEMTVCG